ncbi:MAG: hypothetical protein H7647_08670, partial [Candidatus Heimdallarchaeota archaeon]|nr:hypothetical protein [Candidatus Heimdallarchaeota archaeon]MCK4254499.1 hypothetical protein [Candidatus Heimdallarchaeota archaeon]
MMEDSVLTKTKRFLRKNNIVFRASVLVILIVVTVYSFFLEDSLLRVLTILAICIMIASFLSHYVFNYFYGEGYKLAYVINEILYLFLGIPFLLIAIGYLPLSLYILFVDFEDANRIVPFLIAIMVILQISSFIYILRQRGKERERTIIQNIKYLFDFKARAEEQRKHREQADQIEEFYSGMSKVNISVRAKVEESIVDF